MQHSTTIDILPENDSLQQITVDPPLDSDSSSQHSESEDETTELLQSHLVLSNSNNDTIGTFPINASAQRKVNISIRFANGLPDLPLYIPLSADVSHIKYLIRSSPIHNAPLSSKTIRLIYSGRILQNSFILASFIPIPPSKSTQDPMDSKGKKPENHEDTIYIHCVVAEGPVSETQAPQITSTVTGFDRLLQVGFTADEVDALRQQFHAVRGSDHTEQTEAARIAEENWIDNRDTEAGGSADVNEEGVFDMLWGLIIGFVSGIFVFLWLKEQGIFNRRQQIGIFAGFLVNIAFGILRLAVSV